MDWPITRTTKPTVKASSPRGMGLLWGSTMARIHTIRAAVPIICVESKGQFTQWKFGHFLTLMFFQKWLSFFCVTQKIIFWRLFQLFLSIYNERPYKKQHWIPFTFIVWTNTGTFFKISYLIEEAVEQSKVFRRVCSKDSSCCIVTYNDQRTMSKVPNCICKASSEHKL